ncbi:hypothetical protein QTG54_000036 [Skeletonema marinoi]|uniref:Uncharacterized protein n=1 Tax=Skeletonema marinoi TaxID=267567 RepID=A0AAD8YL95_9STRA|nr:hypothetical protein QTG54_000036 [Skeletonema marinoi]
MMNPLALVSATPSLLWGAVALSYGHGGDALSITNVVSSRRLVLTSSFLPHHHRRGGRISSLNLSLLDKYDGEWSDEEDKLLLREEGNGNLCSSASLFANTKYPSASDMNFNNNLFGWNEIVHSIILSEQQRATNLNKLLCTAMMSLAIGMQPLSAFAHDSNNIMSDVWNYQQGAVTTISNNNAIKSSSILSASTASSEMRVKIDDTIINNKKPSESISPPNSKLSMGVKVEYYSEEIEMMMQAEREQLERMAQVEQEEQQQKIDVVEREQQLLREKEQKEQKMVEEKAAAASAAASVASSAATTSTTAKIVVQPTQQVPPPPTLPSVQIAENMKQQPQTPPSPKINTEKEELIKMLRDTSTISKITKEVPPAISQVADTNNDDYMMSEVDQKQLQLFQVVGVGVLGAGLVNSINSKKEDEDDNSSSEGDNNNPPLLPSSSTFEPSSPPLVKLKTPKPPSEPPIPPSDETLNKVLGLLEDDLQELNKNLELLENDLNELNKDLDSLQDEDGDSNLPSAGGASATSVSNGSYLDSLPSTGSQFELKRSGAGFQSSYLARLGGAAPLQFDYSDTTTKMAEDYASAYDDVDQTSDASSDVDQYQIDEAEELPSTTGVTASATAAVSTGSYLDSLPDGNKSPTPPSFQSSNVPSPWRASAATVSKGSYLDSLPGGNQFELKRSGTGFQSSYLARLGGAAPLEFDYGASTTTCASSDDQYQIDEAKELPLVPSPTSFSSSDTTYPATANAQPQIIETKSVLPPTTGVTASATAVSTGSYLDSLPDGNQPLTPPSFQSSYVPSAWRASAATVSKGSYLDSLPGGNQFELKRSGTGFQSSYLARLGGAAPLEFDYGASTTTCASSDDQYQIDEANEIPSLPPPLPFPSSDEMSPTEANAQRQIIDTESGLPPTDIASASTVSAGSYLDSLAGSNQPLQSSYLGGLGGYLDSLSGSNQFGLKRSGTAFQSSYLGGLRAGAAPLEFRYVGSSPTLEEDYTSNYDNVDQRSYASSETDQYQNNEAEALPPVPPPQSFSSSDATSPTTSNAQRQIFQTSTGKRMRIDTDVVSDVNVDRAAPPFLRQSPTRLRMFGIKHPRGRHSTRLYMSQQSDEEESFFPSTDALIEVLRRQKMEKDKRDAEYRAQQQQEQRLADQEQRAREEAEQRVRGEEERLRLEQGAKEEAALQMQLQMRMMAAEKKAEEDRMMEQVLMEQKAKEEEAEKLRLQKEEVERLADERRQREEEEAKLREWEEKEERLLLEEKAKEEAEMKEFEERLVIEQRAKEEAELRARREEEERLQSEQRARDEAKLKQQQHEEEMRSRREKEQLLQIEQNMSYLNDALAQVDDRLGALNNDQSEAEVEYLDIDEGIQYLNSAVSEIDSLLSEGDDGY